MRIEKVEIKNFCQHLARSDVLGAGVIGIVGRNGSGKSNYLHAIQRAITGMTPNFGKNEDDVTWGAENGFVRLEFSVGSQHGVIRRDLRSARCKMEFGNATYDKVKDVEGAVYGILGVDPDTFTKFVCVRQGNIEGVLFQRPSDRAKAFQSLFGTENAERLRELLFEEYQTTTLVSRANDILSAQTRLKEADDGIADSKAKLATFGKGLLTDAEKFKLEEAVRLFDEYKGRKTSYDLLVAEEASLRTAISQASTEAGTLTSRQTIFKQALDETRPFYTAAKQQLEQAEATKALVARHTELSGRLRDAEAALAVPEPLCPIDSAKFAEESKDLVAKQSELSSSLKVVNSLGAVKMCWVCGQPINEQHVARHRDIAARLGPIVNSLQASLQEKSRLLDSFKSAHARWETNRTSAVKSKAQVQQDLAALPAAQAPVAFNADEAKAIVADYDKTAADLAQIEKQLVANGAQSHQFNTSIVAVAKKRKDTEKELGPPPAPDSREKAQAALNLHNMNVAQRAELTGRISALETNRASILQELERYKTEESQMGKMKAWRKLLEDARNVLHRDQLPNLVARQYLAALNQRLGKYLDLFEVPYAASIKNDLSIECIFVGGQHVPAERLSGGEKVMLGIAFRFAIYDLFVSNLGLLILDEPTVFLDDDRIDAVFALLERVKSYSKSAGLQLIIVTHEQRLAGVFDKIIRL